MPDRGASAAHIGARPTRPLDWVEAACWAGGIALVSLFALARADRIAGRERDLAAFASQSGAPDQTLWSRSRIRDYRASLALPIDAPVAVLRVPAVKLDVPVYRHANELSLNRGAALIAGMSPPDRGGNTGIAGHRDGFFRVLKDVHAGDLIEIRTHFELHRYRVTAIEIVEESDTHPLADTSFPAVTLVTCYPFYYLGSAPQRFIVRGTYEGSPETAIPGRT